MPDIRINYLRSQLTERFGPHVDLTGRSFQSEKEEHKAALSAQLAALAVQISTACSDAEAGTRVIDDYDDQGIDAVVVDRRDSRARIFLVQAKWSDDGNAGFNHRSAKDLLSGFDLLINREFDQFNDRFQPMVPELKSALDSSLPTIHLVVALAGGGELHPNLRGFLDDEVAKRNADYPMCEWTHLHMKDFLHWLQDGQLAPAIDLEARFDVWGREDHPYTAYFGSMAVGDIAAWYEAHGRGLFDRNIRHGLHDTEVNRKIFETLTSQPERFWYLCNGITIVCERIETSALPSPGRKPAGVKGVLHLKGASIVNGAQTVTQIGEAMSSRPERAEEARVMVRVVSLASCPPEFGAQVTRGNNTQNEVQERDFRSQEQIQADLREQFRMALGLNYAIKRGEPKPAPEAGCTIDEAALALVATDADVRMTAEVKKELASLWEQDVYRHLFRRRTDAYLVWHSVQLFREVRRSLAELGELEGRTQALRNAGDLLITHLVARQLDQVKLVEHSDAWTSELTRVPDLAAAALGELLSAMNTEIGSTSYPAVTVRSPDKVKRLAEIVLARFAGGDVSPVTGRPYPPAGLGRRARKTNAVAVLVKAGKIPDGTVLDFRLVTSAERIGLRDWLAADPARGQAVWRSDLRRPLRWLADQRDYSASGLTKHIRETGAGIEGQVQGTHYWYWSGVGTLSDLAEQVRAEEEGFAEG